MIAGLAIAQGNAALADDPPPPPGQPAATIVPPPSVPASGATAAGIVSTSPATDSAKIKAQTVQKDAEDRVKEKATEIATFLNAGDLDAAGRAQAEQAAELNKAQAQETVSGTRTDVTTTNSANDSAAKVKTAQSNSGCNGTSWVCFFGGALVGSYSLTIATSNARSGDTSHQVVSVAVPTGGVRFAVSNRLSVDLGLYTAIISPQLKVNSLDRSGTGCSKASNRFNDLLPCEGNAVLRPYGALFGGITIGTGSSAIGIITLGLTGGLARTTQDAGAIWFSGLLLGTGGVYTAF